MPPMSSGRLVGTGWKMLVSLVARAPLEEFCGFAFTNRGLQVLPALFTQFQSSTRIGRVLECVEGQRRAQNSIAVMATQEARHLAFRLR